MRRLTATRPILFLSRQYEAGDALPAENFGLTDAWLASGSARWESDEAEKKLEKPAPAQPAEESDGEKTAEEALPSAPKEKPKRSRRK